MQPAAARLLLIGAALLYGVAALGNGLDRWATTHAQTRVIPRQFAALSLQRDASAELTAGRHEQAVLLASRAVLAAPSEAGAVSMLGAALLRSDQSAKAYSAFQVSRQLGWRDLSTQAYWVTAGVSLSDQEMTARHLNALMRFAPGLPQSEEVLQLLESSPAGRAQLARYLAQGPNWLALYAKGASRLSPDLFAVRLNLLQGAKAGGKQTDCGTVADAITDLAYSQSRYVEAAQLWQLACRGAAQGLVHNPDFSQPQRNRDLPFEWNLPGTGGVSANLGGGQLIVRNENPGDAIVAQQRVFAPVGAVRLAWSAEAEQDAAQLRRAASLLCLNGTDLAVGARATSDGAGGYALDIQVPDGCSPQLLVLRAPREAGEIRFSRVTLNPLTGAGR